MISKNKSLNLTVKLFDEIGRELFSKHFSMIGNDEKIQFKMNDFARGIYFLQILTDDKKWIRRIVKN